VLATSYEQWWDTLAVVPLVVAGIVSVFVLATSRGQKWSWLVIPLMWCLSIVLRLGIVSFSS
jgi:hypothetical protein